MSRRLPRTNEKLDAPETVKSITCPPPRLLHPSAESAKGPSLAFSGIGPGKPLFMSKKGVSGPLSESALG